MAGKVSGNLTYYASYVEESPEYDINDLGFVRAANERSVNLGGSYNSYDPKASWMNRYRIRLETDYRRLVAPNVFTDFAISANGFFRTTNFIGAGGFARLEPIQTFDYFEPRTSDFSQFYAFPRNFMIGSFVSTNYNNPIAFNLNMDYRVFDEENRNLISFEAGPRWRANDKLSMDWSYNYSLSKNDVGYISNSIEVAGVNDPVIFGKRDRRTVVNEFRTKFTFNENMYVNLIGRHYWSKVTYNSYHLLGDKGELIDNPIDDLDDDGRKTYDVNFNLLNMDLVYNWRFAPGSDLIFVLKNFANNGEDIMNLRPSYMDSAKSVYEYNNNFSMNLKVLYFLDYFRVSNSISKRNS
jgi:hypothetical protein